MAADNIVTLNKDNFASEVLKASTPVLVDFWAEWCGPCKAIAPILDEIAREYGDRVRIAKINIDHNRQTPLKYGVRGIPTLILFKDGRETDRVSGALDAAGLRRWIAQHS